MLSSNDNKNEIGVVLGSKPATPVDFYIAVGRDKVLQLDDAVFTYVDLKINGKPFRVSFYGIVDSIERSYEGLDFDSDMYYIDSVRVEERHVAHVKITRIEPEYFIPPRPGNPVFLAGGEEFYNEFQKAIGADKMSEKIPAGFSTTGQKIFIDLEFVNGKKGAHINISGISGVATKTTYGIFLLHEIMRYAREKKHGENYVGIIFNVKGEDLLFMDKPNKKIYEISGEDIKSKWTELSDYYGSIIDEKRGLSAFRMKFCAPKRQGRGTIPDVNQRDAGDFMIFGWSAYTFSKDGIMKYAILEGDSDNIRSLIEDIAEILFALSEYAENNERKYIISPFEKEKKIKTYKDIRDLVEDILFSDKRSLIEGRVSRKIEDIRRSYTTSTKRACMTRIHMIRKIESLIGPDFEEEQEKIIDLGKLNLSANEIYVFHITPLDEVCQRIVVGSILSKIFKQQSEEGAGQRKVIVFLDELSKYAPREKTSPIKEVLEDIAERGRSLGVILIGAQQSARTVSRKIIMNSSVKIVGRMSSEEIESSEYGFLTRELKMRLLASQPGNMVVNQPSIYVPIMVRFPFPFWATRKEEVYEDVSNKEGILEKIFGDIREPKE